MEFITSAIDQLNWWAIVVATLSTLPVGYVWYGLKIGFGKRWAKLNSLKAKDLESSDGMAKTFAIMLITSLLTAIVIASLVIAAGVTGFWNILVFGVIAGLLLRGGAHFIHNGFTRKPLQLTLIDAGHDLVSLTVITLIVGLWR